MPIRRHVTSLMTALLVAGLGTACAESDDRAALGPVDSGLVSSPSPQTSIPTPSATAAATATQLAPGERPPQFIIVSFDGAGTLAAWQRWRDLTTRLDATVTYFLSGTYLLPEDKASLYRPPGHPAGTSLIGFSASPEIRQRMEFARQAYLAGDEIGTHFNGHFCADDGSNEWTTADWAAEIAQFDSFLTNWRLNAGALDAPATPFGPADVVGERTPCLEGSMDALFPALLARGFRYDSSGDHGPLRWPVQRPDGLWEIPMQVLRLAGDGTRVLSMDWNFYNEQSGAAPADAERFAAIKEQVLETYRNAYQAVYDGNRAPLILGNHFNTWNGGSYADALQTFMEESCWQPETQCVSFVDLVNWLETQSDDVRSELTARPTQEMSY